MVAGVLGCAALLGTCSRPPSLLEEIRLLGELRAVTRDGPNTYFEGADGPSGPEYDLLKGFARYLGVRLRVTLVDRAADVVPELTSGRVHVAAAALAVDPKTARSVDFGPTYQQVTEHLVYKEGRRRPRDLGQLQGKRLEVPTGTTSTIETLRQAQVRHPDLVWTENPSADQSDLVTAVSRGQLDYTVVKSTAYAIYRSFMPDLRVAFDLAVGQSLAWAFPKRYDDSLEAEAEKYFATIRAEGTLAQVLDQYYGRVPRIDYVGTRDFLHDVRARLPPFRHLFENAADAYSLDWRLLAAIGYQESTWDPEAVSATGVRGIMMLTEDTAAGLGVEDRTDAAQSIRGGARYFADILGQIPDDIPDPDRTWFALAAYNMGWGHVLDARRLTASRGGDPDRWVEVRPNVKLLADPDHCAQTRHGCARGGETVAFVDNIRRYYSALQFIAPREGETGTGWIPPNRRAGGKDAAPAPRRKSPA